MEIEHHELQNRNRILTFGSYLLGNWAPTELENEIQNINSVLNFINV